MQTVPDGVGSGQAGRHRHPIADSEMTRTTKTAAAAPAPRNGRSGKVRTYKASADAIANADFSAADLPEEIAAELIDDAIAQPSAPPVFNTQAVGFSLLAASLADLLAEAEAEEASARRIQREPIARVTLTPEQGAAMEAAGWKAPRVDANFTATPEPRQRQNACKGGAAYRVALTVLQGSPMHAADLAALWIAAGNQPRPLNGILRQLANRAGRKVRQEGALLMLA